MKLDYDCVRNILLTVESLEYNQTLGDQNFNSFELLKDYPKEKICYTVARLEESGYIPKSSVIPLIGGVIYNINALTWDGHQYLDCIRNKSVWEKVKNRASALGNVPFKILKELAFMELRSKFGLPDYLD